MATLPKQLDPAEWAIGKDGHLVRKLGSWAREKLFYVESYIDIFNSGMKKKWPRRTYVDLFSGPGRVLIGGAEEIDGSPLLARDAEISFTDLFLNDIEPQAISALEARFEAESHSARVEFLTLDCNQAVREIRQRLPANTLDLAFIDPTNWQITFDSLKHLTAGRRMDLIITFHVGGMKRAVEYAPAALDAFFGIEDWRSAYAQSAKAGKREGSRILLDCYESQLRTIGYKWAQDDVRITNQRNLGLYHLVFASKNPRGEDFWQKITAKSSAGQLKMKLFRERQATYVA